MSRGATASDDAVVIRAAAVLGLVWLGDALIYVVLPLHAASRQTLGAESHIAPLAAPSSRVSVSDLFP